MMNDMEHWTIRTYNYSTEVSSYSVYSNMSKEEAIRTALADHPNSVEHGAWRYILDICKP